MGYKLKTLKKKINEMILDKKHALESKRMQNDKNHVIYVEKLSPTLMKKIKLMISDEANTVKESRMGDTYSVIHGKDKKAIIVLKLFHNKGEDWYELIIPDVVNGESIACLQLRSPHTQLWEIYAMMSDRWEVYAMMTDRVAEINSERRIEAEQQKANKQIMAEKYLESLLSR